MEIEYLPLRKEEWLSQTPKFRNGTPSNYIIFKVLPNKGATHGELLSKRHSIIMEFNTPVLEGKRDAMDEWNLNPMYPDILCVFGDVTTQDVIEYLQSPINYKKIFCTSQAYLNKVVPALQHMQSDYYNEFFLLIDECDKLGNDSDYRSEITLPINDFFKFKEKAMVSATAVKPSDPRFEINGFKILKIKPLWDYRERVTIVNTNNVIFSLLEVIKVQSVNKTFIFLNNTDMIYQIISVFGLHNHCRVFCAENSVQKLKREYGFTRAQSTLGNFEDYNFLTSRNFSAVDIKLVNEKPDVILVTHVFRGTFTMLDPYADSVQIFGRLRNGNSSFTHITNFNSELQSKSPEEAKQHIITNVKGYQQAVVAKQALCDEDITVEVNVYDEIINGKFKRYIEEDNQLNFFMLDNYKQEQKINGCYRSISHLKEGYIATEFFIPIIEQQYFTQNDKDILDVSKNEAKKNKIERIANELKRIENRHPNHIVFNFEKNPWDRRKTHPDICEMYDELKYEGLERLDFEEHRIKKEIKRKLEENIKVDPKLIDEIHALYKIGENPTKDEISTNVTAVYKKFGLLQKVKPTEIELFFDIKGSTKKTDKKQLHTWKILGKKYPKIN